MLVENEIKLSITLEQGASEYANNMELKIWGGPGKGLYKRLVAFIKLLLRREINEMILKKVKKWNLGGEDEREDEQVTKGGLNVIKKIEDTVKKHLTNLRKANKGSTGEDTTDSSDSADAPDDENTSGPSTTSPTKPKKWEKCSINPTLNLQARQQNPGMARDEQGGAGRWCR